MHKIALKTNRQARILYCGDGTLKSAARYLQGVLKYLGHRVFHVPSETPLREKQVDRPIDLIVLSDYPSARIENRIQKIMLKKIEQGTGFLMIGGYGCFHGKDGFYQNTDLADALPVYCASKDDRVQRPQGLVMVRKSLEFAPDLDFAKSPVFVGYNRVHAKKDSRVILNLKPLTIQVPKIGFLKEEHPLLVFGKYHLGKTAAFTTDIAPHWCGGFVDWGKTCVLGKNLELGHHYIRFVQCLTTALF
jgi:uncharacterized membrane protein